MIKKQKNLKNKLAHSYSKKIKIFTADLNAKNENAKNKKDKQNVLNLAANNLKIFTADLNVKKIIQVYFLIVILKPNQKVVSRIKNTFGNNVYFQLWFCVLRTQTQSRQSRFFLLSLVLNSHNWQIYKHVVRHFKNNSRYNK